jgi:hypothetical protein
MTRNILYLMALSGSRNQRFIRARDLPIPSASSTFSLRPSTSVLLSIESFLYPESYCSLGHTRIHSLFDQGGLL